MLKLQKIGKNTEKKTEAFTLVYLPSPLKNRRN